MRPAERTVHLGADLVAADARARADHRDDPSLAAHLAQCAHPLLEHARGQPAPACVKHRDRRRGPERDRQAVGGQHHRTDPRKPGGVTVGVDRQRLSAGPVDGSYTRCTVRPVNLTAAHSHCRPSVLAEPVAGRTAVLVTVAPRAMERLPCARVVNSA